MSSADIKRGTKRSIDDLESEEALHDRFGRLLWAGLVFKKLVNGLVESKLPESHELFVIGFSSDGTQKRVDTSTWPSYSDLWRATKKHPGETVETTIDTTTGLSRPTDNELARRADTFIKKALGEQKKYGLSRNKPDSYGLSRNPPGGDAIIVSKSSRRLHPDMSHPGASAATALTNVSFDFFDDLANQARQRCMQETHALRVHTHKLFTKLQDERSALSEERKAHHQTAERTRRETLRLTEETEKEIQDFSSKLDVEKQSRKKDAGDADAKIQRLAQERDDEKQARQKDMEDANNKIQQLKAECNKKIQATESKLDAEKQARRKAAENAGAAVKRFMAKQKKEVLELSSKHGAEKESLRQASEDAGTEIKRLTAKVQDLSSKLGREEQARRRAVTVAADETQRRIAKHHKEVMQGLTSKHNEEKKYLHKAAEDADTELNRLKGEFQKQSQELEKEKRGRHQDEEDHDAEIQCLMSENKKLKQDYESIRTQLEDKIVKLDASNRALQKKVDRFMAVANDHNPVLV